MQRNEDVGSTQSLAPIATGRISSRAEHGVVVVAAHRHDHDGILAELVKARRPGSAYPDQFGSRGNHTAPEWPASRRSSNPWDRLVVLSSQTPRSTTRAALRPRSLQHDAGQCGRRPVTWRCGPLRATASADGPSHPRDESIAPRALSGAADNDPCALHQPPMRLAQPHE